MSVLDRVALEESPLADLHALASELGIDGYRRLRKAALVDAILERQGGDSEPAEKKPARSRRSSSRTGTTTRARRTKKDAEPEGDADAETETETVAEPAPKRTRARRTRKTADTEPAAVADALPEEGTTDEDAGSAAEVAAPAAVGEQIAEGVVELLGNGSGFVRVSPPDPSDDDVYISAAQVRRCELVSGDRVTGPVRPPRRSERYPSLVRIDTINGRPADEVTEGTHFEDLPAAFPTQRFALGADDPTLKAIEWLTPIGKGSRVAIVGGARAGKSEALRRLAGALAAQDGVEVTVVLTGARPEEITEWKTSPPAEGLEPAVTLTPAASADAQASAVERAVETAKRIAARGGDAVVLIDSLSSVPPAAARRVLAAARDIVDGGSLTIVAVTDAPTGGETTVVALDVTLASTGRFPALDLVASGTLRPELLVGEAGAEAIAKARLDALG